ncbi:Pleckstrin y-like domain B member 1 [Mactra antiquata]
MFEVAARRKRKKNKQDQVQVTETEHVVKVHSEQPHLVSMGSGRLSTAVTILPLQQGRTTVGTIDAVPPSDIIITGTGVESEHCYIDNQDGIFTLIPVAKQCYMDGSAITSPTKLAQDGKPVLCKLATSIFYLETLMLCIIDSKYTNICKIDAYFAV